MTEPALSERQRKWFESVRSGLERETGKSLEEWKAIALTCPETAPRARLKWFKDHHGLLQNRASYVINETFGSLAKWTEPDQLIDALWSDSNGRAIFEAVDAAARVAGEGIQTPRKGYTAWARNFQFAALKPAKGGTAVLGLAVLPDASPRLQPGKPNDGWSERLKAKLPLASPADVDADLKALLKAAWERS